MKPHNWVTYGLNFISEVMSNYDQVNSGTVDPKDMISVFHGNSHFVVVDNL